MSNFLALSVVGLVSGCVYAITATGLVVTYTTTGVFNFAHGAIGMFAAFSYWQLEVAWHWPTVLAIVVVVFVEAPLIGAFVERVLIRTLHSSGGTVETSVTVSLGLLLFLIGAATLIWDPNQPRFLPQFFAGDSVTVLGVNITYQQMAVLIVTVVVAVVLRVFMYRTRTGTAMRAVVDNRELSGLAGASPAYFGQLGWMMGATLAAVAGVLLAALVTLDIQTLTLVVINGYAAAMVGRLRNLPLTFLGGVLLGLAQSYATGYLPVGNLLLSISPVIPMIFLFVILCLIPEGRVPGRVQSVRSPRVPKLKESLLFGGLLIAGAWVVSRFLSDPNLLTASHGLAYALIMLSLVPLSGYGGQVCLCQLTFAGIGAVVMDKSGDGSTWWGLVLALVITGAVGAILALPALRLRGIYLALLTLSFGVAMDSAFFGNESIFGSSSSLFVGRVSVPGLSLISDRAFFVAMCVVFAVFGVLILLLRRSAFGRRLVAVHDSPAACATLGISLIRTKVLVFALSAGMAGFAGALYGGAQGQVGPSDFVTLLSLTLFLLAVANGMRTVSGMLIGGVLLALFPVISTHLPWLRDLTYLGAGIIALSIGRNPDGLGNNPVSQWRARKAAEKLSLPLLDETDPVLQDAEVVAHVGD